jgi:hypothetical protein
MQLEYVGQLPADNGYETAIAWVYRVKNADQYAKLNRGNGEFPCHIRYLTIQQRGPRYIRLGALDLANWRDYRGIGHGLCFGEGRILQDVTDAPGS